MLSLLLFSSLASAQVNYGYAGCIVPSATGDLRFVPGIPGCSEKERKSLKNGEQVTYEMTVPDYSGPGSAKAVTKTYTLATSRQNGRLQSLSTGEGPSLEKADLVSRYEYNPEAENPSMSMIRTIITKADAGKRASFVTYDRNLCARLNENGQLSKDFTAVTMCTQVLQKYEETLREFAAKMAKENLQLGVMQLEPYGMPGAQPLKPQIRALRVGSSLDTMTAIGSCRAMMGFGTTYSPPPPAPPKESSSTSERNASFRQDQ